MAMTCHQNMTHPIANLLTNVMKELDFYSAKMENAKKVTSLLSDFLNNFQYKENSAYFNEAMSREHRTLQQNFMRLIMGYLEFCASEDYRTDGRNQASKELAKVVMKALEEKGYYLPTV